ncbi:MAG: right-handed parallel beta-helix repeat-containing protein [Candidatus Thorarchaeota archaeon]|nr:MAG: right-handed parallel beta-helix repeat-containing protein [Candidatus Thorarchaeota archaeon]
MKVRFLFLIMALLFSVANPQLAISTQEPDPTTEIVRLTDGEDSEYFEKGLLDDGTLERLSPRWTQEESNLSASVEPPASRIDVSSRDPHDAIIITSDDEFESQGWPGSGTVEDPYVISGWIIFSGGPCIEIRDTIVHFAIRDCTLVPDPWSYLAAIMLSNVQNGVIEQNFIQSGSVELDTCVQITVSHNDFHIMDYIGIDVYNSYECFFGYNDINGADYAGIRCESSSENIYTGNRIRSSSDGIMILDEESSNFTFNYLDGIWNTGIIVAVGQDNFVFGNLLSSWAGARDDGANTKWDDGVGIGNCWGLYEVSTPYELPGEAGGVDHFPIILEDPESTLPIIARPHSIVNVDGVDSAVTWVVWSDQGTFSLRENDSEVQDGAWEGSGPFEFHLLDTSNAVYNYTLTIHDSIYGSASDSLYLIVPGFIILTPPCPPMNMQRVLGSGEIEISWDAPTHDGNLPLLGYRVYRGSTPYNYEMLVEIGPLTTFADSSILPDRMYFYVVTAFNGLLEGESSSSVNNLIEHDRIHVFSNNDLAELGLPGNGTEENPFRLVLFNITSADTPIIISNTDAFFVVESCWASRTDGGSDTGVILSSVRSVEFRFSCFDGFDKGLDISYCRNITVSNCTWKDNYGACTFFSSTSCEIVGTDFIGCGYPVDISSSMSISIRNSSFTSSEDAWNTYRCVYVGSSVECSFSGCTFSDSQTGIRFESSVYGNVTSCTFDRVGEPLTLWNSDYCVVLYCDVVDSQSEGNGITLIECNFCSFFNISLGGKRVIIEGGTAVNWLHSFVNVTTNGKPIGYFANYQDNTIDSTLFSQLILAVCYNVSVDGHHLANISSGVSIVFSNQLSIQNLITSNVWLESANRINLKDMSVYESEGDLHLSSSSSILLDNISFTRQLHWGKVDIRSCHNVSFVDSRIDVMYEATRVWYSDNCSFTRVAFDFRSTGLQFYRSPNPRIRNCRFNGEDRASIYLEMTSNALIEDCILVGGGLEINSMDWWGDNPEDYWIHSISNVTVNGNPILYMRGESGVEIHDGVYSQIMLVNCVDVSIRDVTVENASIGLQMTYTSGVTIRDIEIANQRSEGGRAMLDCAQISIHNLQYHDNEEGLRLWSCADLVLNDSSFEDCGRGVYFEWSAGYCYVTSCYFSNCGDAINVDSGYQIFVTNNIIREGYTGIRVNSAQGAFVQYNDIGYVTGGLYLYYASGSQITNNIINHCSGNGVENYYGDNNLYSANRILYCDSDGIVARGMAESSFTYNEIGHNGAVGLRFWDGPENFIFGNLFYANGEHDAEDDGTNNQWDDGESIGNCWGMRSLEVQRSISGTADSVDRFPISTDDVEFESPIISSPRDVSQYYTDRNPLTWVAWVLLGDCTVLIDGLPVLISPSVSCGPITVMIHELDAGTHNFTIVVMDEYGTIDSDTVLVTITTNDVSLPLLTSIIAGAAVVLVICYETTGESSLLSKLRREEEDIL